MFEEIQQMELAIGHYREAIRIEPYAEDVRQHLLTLEKAARPDTGQDGEP